MISGLSGTKTIKDAFIPIFYFKYLNFRYGEGVDALIFLLLRS